MTGAGRRVGLRNDALVVDAGLTITFQRTLRVPNDGRRYPLPAGLGAFPVRPVRGLRCAPPGWGAEDYAIPMYVREAMWLGFDVSVEHAFAVQVGLGPVNAVSGQRWTDGLRSEPQNYLVVPIQPWLDGVVTSTGVVRQFVAVPVGEGATVEEQVTGQSQDAVLRLRVLPPRSDRPALLARRAVELAPRPAAIGPALGIGPGGQLRQTVYADPFGIETWDTSQAVNVAVHLVESGRWTQLTGERPPPSPVTAATYADFGLPWFELYDETATAATASGELAGLTGIDAVNPAGVGGSGVEEPSQLDVDDAGVTIIRVSDAQGPGHRH